MGKTKFFWPIIGHKNIINYLESSLKRGRLSHAYLFTGPSGVGKTIVANYFIKSLFCLNKEKIPCERCLSCQQIEKGIHPDVIYLKKEKERKDITIGQIRQLQKFLSLSRLSGSYKVALIQEAELLNKEAANSLLKTIEEPAEKVIIILITQDIHRIVPTIVSRCQVIRFYPVSSKEIVKFLEKKYSLKKGEAVNLANFSGGRPGKIISLLNEESDFKNYQELIGSFLNLFEEDLRGRLKTIKEIRRKDFLNSKEISSQFLEKQTFFKETVSFLIEIIRDLILIKLDLSSLLKNYFLKSRLKKVAESYSLKGLINLLRETEKTGEYLEMNVNPSLAIENLLLNFQK